MSVFRTTIQRSPGRYGRPGVVIVQVAKSEPDGKQQSVATVRCDLKFVPQLVRLLKGALKIARDEGLTIPEVRNRLICGRRS